MVIKIHEAMHNASLILAFLIGLSCVVLPVKAVEQPIASMQGVVRFG